MKKSIIFLSAAAALVMAAGCNKARTVELNNDAEIAMNPFVKGVSASKAIVTDTKLPEIEDLQVFGYFNSDSPEGTPVGAEFTVPYINDKTFSFDKEGVWRGSNQKYYWPKTGSIVFAGYHGIADVEYAPADEQVMKIVDFGQIAGHPVRFADYTYAADGQQLVKELDDKFDTDYLKSEDITAATFTHSNYIDFDESYFFGENPDIFYDEDLMYFPVTATSYNKTNGSEGVPVVLHHALSWISFQAVSNEAADAQFRIDSIFVNKVLRDGDAVITGTQNSHTCVWTPKAPERTLVQFIGTGSDDPSEKDNYVVRYNGGKPEAFGLDFVIIPQPATTLTIHYSQYAAGYGKWVKMAPATVEMAKLVEAGTPIKISNWEPAKHYTYTISFSYDETDEIKISPSVAPWEEVKVAPYEI